METITQITEYKGETVDDRGWKKTVAGYEILTTDQRILLFIEDESKCCESWGYFWCNDTTNEFIGAQLLGVALIDTELNTTILKKETPQEDGDDVSTACMFVNINTDRGVLQFVAYNCQNGYYGHAATVSCKQLNHSATL